MLDGVDFAESCSSVFLSVLLAWSSLGVGAAMGILLSSRFG